MGAPPLGIGQHGKINTSRLSAEGEVPERWRAYCLYRGKDGKTSKPERRGEGATAELAKKAAIKSLEKHLRELATSTATKLGRTTRLRVAVLRYLDGVKIRRKGTTYDLYRRWANARVIPDLGDLTIAECTAGRLQEYFDELAVTPSKQTGVPLAANSRRAIRKVLNGTLKLAIRDEAITANPISALEPIEGKKKPARGYDAAETAAFYEALDNDRIGNAYGHTDLIKFQFETGARIGEALAVRRGDVNLSDEPVVVDHPTFGRWTIPPWTVWFNGNMVRVTGQGVIRHDGKTPSSVDLVGLAPTTCLRLLVQWPADAKPEDPLFPDSNGNFRCPSSTQSNVRRLRKRIGFPDFTTHYGRRSYGTALDSAGHSARQVADGLRKTDIGDTQKSYMIRGLKNPEAVAAIEKFLSRPRG